MPTKSLSIIGAGGHAAVVGDSALSQGVSSLVFYSQDVSATQRWLLKSEVILLNDDADLGNFHVAIGDNSTRERLYKQFSTPGNVPNTVIHPQAILSSFAEVGSGAFVAAAAVVAARTTIGMGVIVNHRAVVDHDVTVGDFSHIAPGVVLGGGARVGDHVLVGAGATVLPGVSLGDRSVIGAGAVVLHDVSADLKVAGVPARRITRGF